MTGVLPALLILMAAPAPLSRRPPDAAVVVIGERPSRYRGEPISLDLKDADLVDVCLSFAKIARANVVVDPGVRGTVTVRLRDVPWAQALELILRMNGYAMVRDGRILRIGRPEALVR
jgi:type II secretory pathway component HofQ